MNQIKVITIVGTRPEIIRLSRVLAKLDEYYDHSLIHTGQNHDYELNEIFFKDLKLRKPDYFLNASGETAIVTIGNVIIEVDKILEKIKPEAVLILGDTNSSLAAIPAKRRKIPIFHMEAGNRCFDMRVPEEINRKIVDHISDINLPYSTIARDYLISEGIPPDRIIKTGSPMYEVINYYLPEIKRNKILERLNIYEGKYFLVSIHREENVESEENFRALIEIINLIAEKYSYPIIVSTHPRTQKKIDSSSIIFSPLVQLHKPFSFTEYVCLEIHSMAVLSDSGTINEESSILNFPALNMREAFERPEAFEEGAVMMVGFNISKVLKGLEILDKQPRGQDRLIREVTDYTMPNVSDKVVRIINSYIDYVQRVVWKKY